MKIELHTTDELGDPEVLNYIDVFPEISSAGELAIHRWQDGALLFNWGLDWSKVVLTQ